MLAALVIVFREVLEAGLIVGVVLAASHGVAGRNRAVALGIAAGIAGSVVVAAFAAQISNAFDGRGQELFAAGVLALAVAMLAWHVVWMSEHARELTRHMRELGAAVGAGTRSVAAIGIATFSAVMREGSEVVLFLTGIAMQPAETAAGIAAGSAAGLLLGALVSAVLYLGLSAIPLRRLFSVTGVLVTLLAAGLAAEAVHQVSNAGLLPAWLDTTLWDSSWLLSEDGFAGRLVAILVGYRDHPTLGQLIAYAATATTILALSGSAHRRPAETVATSRG